MSLLWIILLVWLAPALLFCGCLLWVYTRAAKVHRSIARDVTTVPAPMEAPAGYAPPLQCEDNDADSRPALSQLAR